LQKLIAFIGLLVIVQTSEAQYRLAARGDTIQMDSAVVVHLPRYRQESTLIKTQKAAIDSLVVRTVVRDTLINSLRFQSTLKDGEIILLNQKSNLLQTELDKKGRWFRKPEVIGAAGLLLGLLFR